MRLGLTLVSGLLASTATLYSSEVAGQSGPPLLPLTVQVIDFHGVAATTMIAAQHHVARVFGAIGVSTRWRQTSSLERIEPAPVGVILLLSPAMSARKIAESQLTPPVLAVTAPPPTCRSWIFTERVLDAASLHDLAPGELLGHTIAHEIAHSVGHVAHAATGAMRESVTLTSAGLDDMFGAAEAEAVRAALRTTSAMPTRLAAR